VLDPGEECDHGEANSDVEPDGCRTDCTAARCGDGVVDPGEACDDGNHVDWDGCNDCRIVEFRVNTVVEEWQGGSAVTMADNGRFVIAWFGGLAGVSAQRYSASGMPEGGNFQVSTIKEARRVSHPVVAMDAEGAFVVVWLEYDFPARDFGDVLARRYDADGAPRGPEFQVNVEPFAIGPFDRLAVWSTVAMAADGRFIVAWTSGGKSYDIVARRYDAAGCPGGPELRVDTHEANRQQCPSAAMAPDGHAVVAWWSQWQDGSWWGVYARLYGADGQPGVSEFQVNTHTALHPAEVSVGMFDNGSFLVAWPEIDSEVEYGSESCLTAWLRRYTAEGIPEGPEVPMALSGTVSPIVGGSDTLMVATAGDSRVVMAWTAIAYMEGDQYDGYAQLLGPDLLPDGPVWRLNDYVELSQSVNGLAMGADGRFVATWASADDDNVNDSSDVMAKIIGPDGEPMYVRSP